MADKDNEDKFEKDFKNFNPEYRKVFGEVMGDIYGCRMCGNYIFDRDAEEIACSKGYFNESGPGASWNGKDCEGSDFKLNPNTRWIRAVYDSDKEKIHREVNGRIRDGKVYGDLKEFMKEDFYRKHRDVFTGLLKDLTKWEITQSSLEELANADSIFAPSFGFGPGKREWEPKEKQYDPEYFYPGKSNEVIARLINESLPKHKNIGLKDIFAQWEVAEAFSILHKYKKNIKNVAKPGAGKYLSTKGVIDFFVNNGLKKYSNITVFAHPLHTYRCTEILEKSLKDAGSKANILIPNTRAVPFDENSVQPWTRSLEDWIISEIISRISARAKGHMGVKIIK